MKKLLFLAVILAFASVSAHAAFEFDKNGMTVVQKNEGDEETELVLKDVKGNLFSVVFSEKIGDNMGKLILKLQGEFLEFKTIQPKGMKFVVSRDSLDINITPASFVVNGKDLLPNVTSGVLFTYQNDLRYNFRIVAPDKNNKDKMIAVRIQGEFYSEERLSAKVLQAVEDPVAYVKKRDPEYLIAKTDELESSLEKLRVSSDKVRSAVMALHNAGIFSGPTPVKLTVIKRVIELKNGNPKLTRKELVDLLEKEKIEASGKEVTVILNVFYNEFE